MMMCPNCGAEVPDANPHALVQQLAAVEYTCQPASDWRTVAAEWERRLKEAEAGAAAMRLPVVSLLYTMIRDQTPNLEWHVTQAEKAKDKDVIASLSTVERQAEHFAARLLGTAGRPFFDQLKATEAGAAALRVAAQGMIDKCHSMDLIINPTTLPAAPVRAAYEALVFTLRDNDAGRKLEAHVLKLEAHAAAQREELQRLGERARTLIYNEDYSNDQDWCRGCGSTEAVKSVWDEKEKRYRWRLSDEDHRDDCVVAALFALAARESASAPRDGAQ